MGGNFLKPLYVPPESILSNPDGDIPIHSSLAKTRISIGNETSGEDESSSVCCASFLIDIVLVNLPYATNTFLKIPIAEHQKEVIQLNVRRVSLESSTQGGTFAFQLVVPIAMSSTAEGQTSKITPMGAPLAVQYPGF